MRLSSVTHDTFVLERVFDAPADRVFAAYADVELRAQWGVPSDDEVIVYAEASFRVGGVDRYRCGPKSDPKYEGTVHYQDIVPSQRIVYAERVASGSASLSASLVTMDLVPDGARTRLVLTDQIASFVGADMIDGAKRGTAAALDNLVRLVSQMPT